MNCKNQEKNQWSLWKCKPQGGYPCTVYFWLNPAKLICSSRSAEPLGFMSISFGDVIGNSISELRMQYPGIRFSKAKHKMTDEQLEKGWLIL